MTNTISVKTIPYELRTGHFASALLDPQANMPVGVGRYGKPAPRRFAVYRNNVMVSLMDALAAAYPSILTIMGQENFNRVARIYAAGNPPATPMMMQFGAGFSDFLADFKPLRGSPFLADVARAERAWLDAWHAADADFLTPEQLGSVEPEKTMQLVLKQHPASHLLRSDFPVFDLFNARSAWPVSGIDLDDGQAILITRPAFECMVTKVDRAQYAFMSALFDGASLAAAISAASDISEAFDPASAFAIILQTGAVHAINKDMN